MQGAIYSPGGKFGIYHYSTVMQLLLRSRPPVSLDGPAESPLARVAHLVRQVIDLAGALVVQVSAGQRVVSVQR